MKRHLAGKADERGAVLVLTAAGMVVFVIAAALAIDLGRLASDKRTDQKLADLAALDASRDVTTACDLAKDSVERHGLPRTTLVCDETTAPTNADGDDVLIGRVATDGTFVRDLTGDAVQVRVRSAFKAAFPFVGGPDRTAGEAVAGIRNPASFSLGSGVASVDASRSTLLNRTVGQMLCSTVCATGDAGLSVVSWQGLASGHLTVQALQTSLGNAGFSTGSVSQLLSASMTLNQLYTATASALTTAGDTANANVFSALALKATSSAQITLGQLIHVQQGAEDAALGTSINLLQLVTGTAEVANGSHMIDVPSAGITVGGVTSTRVQMTIIEPPVIFIGHFGDVGVTTAQVSLTVTPTLDVTIPLVATIKGPLPIAISGGSATGTLAAEPTCPSAGNKSFLVSVTTHAAQVTQNSTLNVTVLGLLGGVGLLNTTGDVTSAASPPTVSPPFVEQGTIPQTFLPSTWHVGGTSLNLDVALSGSGSNSLVNNILDILLDAVRTVVADVDAAIIQPLLQSLGLDVGNADVAPLSVVCGQPTLLR